jgi:hypothetical protein
MSKALRQIRALAGRTAVLPFVLLLTVREALALELPKIPLPNLPIPGLPLPGITPPDKNALPNELTRGGDLRSGVLKLVNYALGFVGLIGVVVVVYAGFLYLTSFGDEERGKKARQAIIYAVIGIFLILFSWVITTTVINLPKDADIGQSGNAFPDPA